MEKAARHLLRLIPRAVDPEAVGGAMAAMTGPEVAGLLAGLTPPVSVHMVRARVLGDQVAEDIVREWFLAATIRISHEDGWGDVPHHQKKLLARMLGDDFYPGRCDVCRGRGEVPNPRGIPIECPCCHGSGRNLRTVAMKANVMGVSETTWRKRWASRYACVLRHAQALESNAFEEIEKKLRRSS